MGRKLYHYCTSDTFKQIISNKCIWLSNVCKSTDASERIWALELIEKALVQLFKEQNVDIGLKYDFWYSDYIGNHLEYLLHEIKSLHNSPCLVTCFSTEGDLLSQWREYGDKTHGISIGFDFSQLSKIGERKSNVVLDRVLYKEEEQIEEILYFAEYALDYAKGFAQYESVKGVIDYAFGGDFSKWLEHELETFGEVFADYMLHACAIIKNPTFYEEREWRIYYNSGICYDDDGISTRRDRNYKRAFNKYDLSPMSYYKNKKDEEVEYMELSFNRRIEDNIIPEIIIGANCTLSIEDVRKLLDENGYSDSIVIRKSQTTYRP